VEGEIEKCLEGEFRTEVRFKSWIINNWEEIDK
jgi:hypothetical protein